MQPDPQPHPGRAWPVVACMAAISVVASGAGTPAAGDPPEVYDTPFFQSPVRMGPGELLVIAGHHLEPGAEVTYARVVAGNVPPPAPPPASSTADLGRLQLVAPHPSEADSYDHTPHSITGRVPRVVDPLATYVLYVQQTDGVSDPILVNDPRPKWASPAVLYSVGARDGLERTIRVVGRNLWPRPGIAPVIRLEHDSDSSLSVDLAALPGRPNLRPYLLEAPLPVAALGLGSYSVSVTVDDSGPHAVENKITVVADPAPTVVTSPHSYAGQVNGACQPGDGADDTGCVRSALADLVAQGGGTLELQGGSWDFADVGRNLGAGQTTANGILVPPGIDLVGPGTLRWRNGWGAEPLFSLQGDNRVLDLRFEREPNDRVAGNDSFLYVGEPVAAAKEVDHITIARNTFVYGWWSIFDGGWPTSDVVVADNDFHVFYRGVGLARAEHYNRQYRPTITDAVVRHNRFWPAHREAECYLGPPPTMGGGPIASEIRGGRRIDLSDNDALPLRDAAGEPAAGWRAIHFMSHADSVEDVLYAGNLGRCTGDSCGDGEFITFEAAGNLQAYYSHRLAGGSPPPTATQVTVDELPTLPGKFSHPDALESYFVNQWLMVTVGPGLGQARRIQSYDLDTQAGRTTFTVDPPFDVVPVAQQSRIQVQAAYHNVLMIDNHGTNAGCRKGRDGKGAVRATGGHASFYSNTFDSVMAGNLLEESDGIMLYGSFQPAVEQELFHWFNEISGNTLQLEYRDDDGEWGIGIVGGIVLRYYIGQGWVKGNPQPPRLPVILYGNVVRHNVIADNDAIDEAAITLLNSAAPAQNVPPVVSNLIYGNAMTLSDSGAAGAGDHRDVGVLLRNADATSTALHDNLVLCNSSDCIALEDAGTLTLVFPP